MDTTFTYTEAEQIQRRSKKMLTYIGIFSIVMLFAGLTSAYIVSMSDGYWLRIALPKAFYYSTAVIIASSCTLFLAVKYAKAANVGATKRFVLLTLLLGITFSYFQFKGWGELFRRGHTAHGENIFLVKGEYGKDYTFMYKGVELDAVDGEFYTKEDKLHEKPLKDAIMGSRDVASSYLVFITFLHFLHLAVGLIILLVVFFKAAKGLYSGKNSLGLELTGSYWHFLGGLWIYLLLFLLFIH